jgi:hypothetical protein
MIVAVLAILIGFGKGIFQILIKPLFKSTPKKEIRDLNYTPCKRQRNRAAAIQTFFFRGKF